MREGRLESAGSVGSLLEAEVVIWVVLGVVDRCGG